MGRRTFAAGLLCSVAAACSSSPAPLPVVGSWRMLAPNSALAMRSSTSHAWTGSELFVWGGSGPGCPGGGACGDGALLDPVAGTWRAVDGASAPTARDAAYTVWTDKEVFVWGGRADSCSAAPANTSPMGCPDGALFDPAANSWRPIAAAPATLTGREFGSAVWTGKWVIVWGGLTIDSAGNLLYFGDGARYDPAMDVWLPVSTANAPSPRARQGAVWTGTQMIVWGGENYPSYLGDGAAYDPDLDAWASISLAGAPRARNYAAATWTGQAMVLTGGHDDSGYFRDGGLFDPPTNTWGALTVPAPGGFISSNEIAWTGTEVLTWSGSPSGNWGGLFDPLSKRWQQMAPPPTGFTNRVPEVLAWTGTEMIVWGGQSLGSEIIDLFDDGAVYDPP